MSGYIGNIPVPQATQTRDVFTATSGQTSFATSGYTPGFLDVWLNGVKLVNGTDFTATNGSDVVLSSGAATSDIVEVLSYSTYEVNAQTYTGGLTAKNDGAAAITANRLSSDGAILDLKKDGTTVGTLGVSSNTYLTIGTGDTGILFDNAGNRFYPCNASTQANLDNAIDIGASTVRFKNLYLSGGVYLGGTGGENLLDDYEEGTFTLSATATLSSLLGTWPTSVTANYTKVGSVVTITVALNGANYGFTSLAGYYQWTGLPFTPIGGGGSCVFTTSSISSATAFNVLISNLDFWFYAPNNTTGTNGGVATAVYLTS